MLKHIGFLSILPICFSLPLLQSSLITLRSINPPKGSAGNAPPLQFSPLRLEEWAPCTTTPCGAPYSFVQEWILPTGPNIQGLPACTLAGVQTESYTEGKLHPRYPYQDQVWFLCRNVEANLSYSTSPSPLVYAYLTEEGDFQVWTQEQGTYPNGTTSLNVLPVQDISSGLNIFYTLGGSTTTAPLRTAVARIRADTGPGMPPDVQGNLLLNSNGITMNQLRILNRTLYASGIQVGSGGPSSLPAVFMIGQEGILPTNSRNPATPLSFPLLLSSWTDQTGDTIWFTGLNRIPYLARHNITDNRTDTFPQPPSQTGGGTLGTASWKIMTGRFEGGSFEIYLGNGTHIVKNTYSGLKNGLPYQPVLQAQAGWQYLSVHARAPVMPSPTATASATATSSASASATATESMTATATASASASASSSATSTMTSTASAKPTATSTRTASATSSSTETPTSSSTASPSSSASPSSTSLPSRNNTLPPIPVPDSNVVSESLSPGGEAGVSIAVIGVAVIGLGLLVKFSPAVRSQMVRLFGLSSSSFPKNLPKRAGAKIVSSMSIEISQNPYALAQQRVEQLRSFQKKNMDSELPNPKQNTARLSKREFAPMVTGQGEGV